MTNNSAIREAVGNLYPCVRALRFYTATTRGFRDRERKRIAAFVMSLVGGEKFTEKQVLDWISALGFVDYHDWLRGDTAKWQSMLDEIPKDAVARVRDAAYAIARGSGRKAIAPEAVERIESEFSWPPKAYPPPPRPETEGLVVKIEARLHSTK